jgi:hypothetical protein
MQILLLDSGWQCSPPRADTVTAGALEIMLVITTWSHQTEDNSRLNRHINSPLSEILVRFERPSFRADELPIT